MPVPRNVAPVDPGAERQVGQDGQLLRRVAAVDVHRRIGLGIAALLGLGQGAGVVGAVLLHLRKDEVARAVENGVDRLDLVGRQRLADGGDDRNAAGHGRLEGDRPAQLAGRVEQLRPMLGQQRLVGRDDVLAAFQQLQHDRAGGLQPADQLHRRHDLRVVGHIGQVGGQQARRQGEVARPVHVGVHDLDQLQMLARLTGNSLMLFQQQPGDAGADRPESNDGDFARCP